MPAHVYIVGDPAPLWCVAPADVILAQIEAGRRNDMDFVGLELAPIVEGESTRTGYVRPRCVAAVMPIDPREYQAQLDDVPEWAT